MPDKQGPLVLVILDGWGLRNDTHGNAIKLARTPHMDSFYQQYPWTSLICSGEDVGLPAGQMGNSEVGHLNIGAGRIVYQELTRISREIRQGGFFRNDVLLGAIHHVRLFNSSLHLMGLLSDGGVHSHLEHLLALIDLAKQQGLSKVYVHCFLDGRDVPPSSALEYMDTLTGHLQQTGTGRVASVMGRYYAMDRDKRWERTEKAYRAMVLGEGLKATSGRAAISEAYKRGETDEFVQPTVIEQPDGSVATVREGDAVIFFNFRPDRARQITRAFVDGDFTGFNRPQHPQVHFVCMTQYDKTIDAPVAFKPQRIVNTLGEVLARHGLWQLRLAETEKYAHVTFFFNGGVEAPNPKEERVLIPSPKVATYDLKPEMSAYEVTEEFLRRLAEDKYSVIIMNYANADMVGHTGVLPAAIRAIEAVDECLGRVVPAVLEKRGTALITADHGNADQMLDEQEHPQTAHTTNQVPFILIGEPYRGRRLRPGGRLEDIAPTMLEILGLEQPAEMTGESLLLEE
ncbi:MAG: 2,3-bisphosphoglycerate-independent phosphoglycerate mutase [Desulfurispora sp.]|uniref:2,3-bisphosphoglycerate-independent phosphoglycerate mutase n=1 Tax=Desulfurispora sp. TaxID=3014275 RepID=UPI004049A580